MNQAIIELTAPDISCGKCKASIEGDLASYPGIKQVTVDVATVRDLPGCARGGCR